MKSKQEIIRKVDDFTGGVQIEPKNFDLITWVQDTFRTELALFWYSETGYVFSLSHISNSWTFRNTVGQNNAKLLVIADNERFSIENGVNVNNNTKGGYFEQYAWVLSENIIVRLTNANKLRLRLGTLEFPEVTKEMQNSWQLIYDAGQKEINNN